MKFIIYLTLSLILIGCSSTNTKKEHAEAPLQAKKEYMNESMVSLSDEKLLEFLKKFSGNILAPSDIEKIDWSNVKTGLTYTYDIVWNPEYQFERVWKLNRIEGDKYIFDSYEKGKLVSNKKTYVNGREYSELSLNIRGKEHSLSDNNCNDFVEGECEYKRREDDYKKTTKFMDGVWETTIYINGCLLYTSPSPRDLSTSRMPSSA